MGLGRWAAGASLAALCLAGYYSMELRNLTTSRVKEYVKGGHGDMGQFGTELYYDIATEFYEYGWGESFHFAPRYTGETMRESLRRHEHHMASRLRLSLDSRVADLGCGIGGPMREMERFTNATITGVTIAPNQVARCNYLQKKQGRKSRCIQGDFSDLSKQLPDDGKFDGVYTIESSCHLNPRTPHFAEIKRLLKPGGLWASYEWVLTEHFDEKNEEHVHAARILELGNGLPKLIYDHEAIEQAKAVGLELVEAYDMDTYGNIPWYEPLVGSWHSNWRSTNLGRFFTNVMTYVLESIHLIPEGSYHTAVVLSDGADALAALGAARAFTPHYFMLFRKPL